MAESAVATFYPFPKLAEFEANTLSPSPKHSSLKKEEDVDALASPIIKKFDADNLMMPTMHLQDSFIEWQPRSKKAMDNKQKTENMFVTWMNDKDFGQNDDLKVLEKDYLDIFKSKWNE